MRRKRYYRVGSTLMVPQEDLWIRTAWRSAEGERSGSLSTVRERSESTWQWILLTFFSGLLCLCACVKEGRTERLTRASSLLSCQVTLIVYQRLAFIPAAYPDAASCSAMIVSARARCLSLGFIWFQHVIMSVINANTWNECGNITFQWLLVRCCGRYCR